jgi:hypothetical protein
MKLGKIEKLSIRDQWKNEEYDFTPWLAREENIQLLGDEVNLDLEVGGIEVPIGSYKADIVAKDSNNRVVIIENQLEKTDHKHLGSDHYLCFRGRSQNYHLGLYESDG